ncbi:MAG TPA: carboxypeptidase-like regulatory domain-containing protein [Kofleriaceae bacterium]|nr:carboxypeptidase-like regulatory domain-containing protein [Kofleriaceae bacterium]
MRHALVRLLAVSAIAYAMACGGDFAGGDDSCSISLIVLPDQPERGDTIEATASLSIDGDLSGIEVIEWSVRYGGADVAYQVSGANGDEVVFTADQAGVYSISASGSVGGVTCQGDARDLNVIEQGAVIEPMRLVVVPRGSSLVPPQTIDFDLPGGAPEYSLSTLSLTEGELAGASVRGPDGEPLSGAYLRAVPAGAGPELWVERFAEEDGQVDLRLRPVAHDVLVVADADLPALFLAGALPEQLNGSIVVDGGVTVTGTVRDPAGDPLAGARVQVTVGGAPSTIGTSDAAGAFTLEARAGGPAAVTVTPPDASGLPALELAGGPAISSGSDVAVTYGAGLDRRTVSPVLRETDGTTPAAGARVTFVSRAIASAGTIAIDGDGAAAAGALVRTAQANGSGVIPDQRLTSVIYDAFVEPGPGAPVGEGVRVYQALDLRTGQSAPASLRLAAPGHITGQVVDAAGAPVAGARVSAAPDGLLARSTAAGGAATSGEDGSFDVRVAADGSYQVRVDGPGGAGRVHRALAAPGALPVELPATLELTGTLAIAGGNRVPGALVQLQCLTCGPDGGPAPVAEAISDAAGQFTMLAPDPGVVAQ